MATDRVRAVKEAIRKLRERFTALGITYAQAAVVCDVAESTVGAWMIGRNEPPIAQLRKLAAMAEVSLAWLLEDDPMYAASPDERALLAVFRRLDANQREAALTILKATAPKP